MSALHFDPKTAIPDLSGRKILVTGGTAGVGCGTVLELATHNPGHIIFTGRNAKAAESVIARALKGVKLTFVVCDTADNASVSRAAGEISAILPDRLDVIACCADIMAKPPGISKDGIEIQFATNQLGHSLLVKKMLPLWERTAAIPDADARIIMVTSVAWKVAPSGGIQFEKLTAEQNLPVLGPWLRCGQSKLANLLYAKELAERYPNILAFSIHPGVVKTTLVTDLTWQQKLLVYPLNLGRMLTPEQGTYNLLWAVTADKKSIQPGGFYMPIGKLFDERTKATEDRGLRIQLWEWTEKQISGYL